MKLLLDAHTFLWFVWDEVQLTNDAYPITRLW